MQGKLDRPKAETEEVELANALLFDTVLKAASTSSAPAGHLPLVGEGYVASPGDIVPMATFSGRPGRGVPTGKQINRTP